MVVATQVAGRCEDDLQTCESLAGRGVDFSRPAIPGVGSRHFSSLDLPPRTRGGAAIGWAP